MTSDDREFLNNLKKMLQSCVGFDGDELATMRRDAYNYYFQRARGDEIKGRSEVVSGDLSSMVEGNLANMVEPLTAKRIAEFVPNGKQDEDQAAIESECINEMLFSRQNGFIEMTCAIKDALLVRNAVVKCYVENREYRKSVSIKNVAPEVVPFVLDKVGEVKVHKYDVRTKQLSATVVKTTQKFKLCALAPENFLIPKTWDRQDLEDISFCAERHIETRAQAVSRGFSKDKVWRIQRWNYSYQGGSEARLPRGVALFANPIDKSQELIQWYEAYLNRDDGTGMPELRRVCFSDNVLLADEPADIICYSIGTCIVNPHTFIGISMYDKEKSVQDISTALNRALLDNVNATNKNRTAHLAGVVESEDLTDGRTNGSIRVNPTLNITDVRQAITAFAVPDTSGNILSNIEHMRRVRSEMGGAALDMATGQMQINDRVGSQGLDRAYSVMEAIGAFMTRVIAHTLVRSMYLVTHEVLRTQWKGPINFKRGENWIETVPAQWPVREAIKVNMGASPAERTRLSNVLDSLMNKMIGMAQLGMEDILVDATVFYYAVVDWLRINDVQSPDRYMLNPTTDRAVQAFKRKAQQAQADKQQQEALLQQSIALEQLRTAMDKYRTDVQTQLEYYKTVLNAQIEEAKLTTGTLLDFIQASSEARRNVTGSQDRSTATEGEPNTDRSLASSGA